MIRTVCLRMFPFCEGGELFRIILMTDGEIQFVLGLLHLSYFPKEGDFFDRFLFENGSKHPISIEYSQFLLKLITWLLTFTF